MKSAKKLVHLAAVLGLAAGALVASAPAGTAVTAATPTCETGIFGVRDSNNTLVIRHVKNTGVVSERTKASPISVKVSNLLAFDSVKVSGGFVTHIEAIVPGSNPRRYSVRDITAEPNLTLQPGPAYGPGTFNPRLVAGSGRYYVYTIGNSGDLLRFTRLKDSAGRYYYGLAKVVERNMSGFRTLSYYASYQLGGKWTDFLYGTTATGALKQIRIPWSAPSDQAIRTEASSGFAGTTGLSLSFCNQNDNYLSVVAINRSTGQARWFTKAGVLQSSGGAVIDRGLIQPDADWRLHATL